MVFSKSIFSGLLSRAAKETLQTVGHNATEKTGVYHPPMTRNA